MGEEEEDLNGLEKRVFGSLMGEEGRHVKLPPKVSRLSLSLSECTAKHLSGPLQRDRRQCSFDTPLYRDTFQEAT